MGTDGGQLKLSLKAAQGKVIDFCSLIGQKILQKLLLMIYNSCKM